MAFPTLITFALVGSPRGVALVPAMVVAVKRGRAS